jgi:acylphosphatase
MAQREFNITIAPDGNVEVHVKGYKGKSCLEVIKMFEQVVGEIKSRQETTEFYEPDEQVQLNIDQKH